MRSIRIGFWLLAAMLLAFPATAHPVPFSYLDLQLGNDGIDVSLTIHIFDLAHDLQITPIERLLDSSVLSAQDTAIRSLLMCRLKLSADGRELMPLWMPPAILAERQSVRFHLRFNTGSPPGNVSLSTLMFPYDPMHQTFVNVYEADTLTPQTILDANHTITEYFAGTRQG